jgi:hypothetical protein
MSHKILRQFIREAIATDLRGSAFREELGSLASDEEPEIAPHLSEEEADLTPADCWGPVPPTSKKPGVYADPFAVAYGPGRR